MSSAAGAAGAAAAGTDVSLDTSDDTLSQLFDRGFKLHNQLADGGQLDPASKEYQNRVRKAILMLEDATRLVSVLEVFSSNELVSEVATEHLKYFLLPALLGSLHGMLREDGLDGGVGSGRMEVIRVQEAYFMDFLRRCKDYEISPIELPQMDEKDEALSLSTASAARPGPPDMAKMSAEREAKMRRFRERKELENRLKTLEEALTAGSADEDAVREYHLSTIRRFVGLCLDDMSSFAMEKPILAHMAKVRSGQATAPPPQRPPRTLKPIIITRDAAQKEVFGTGYKNLPIFSIEEFYEQRVRDGWFPAPGQARGPSNSLQDMARDEEAAREREEEEEREKEKKEEEDDDEELAKKRNFDEYKDWHKRGEGNRHNKG